MSRESLLFGKKSEAEAAQFLQERGYRIVEKNYRTPFGEIDLIAYDGKTVVFIEVKARNGRGLPHWAVDGRKQKKVSLVALSYITRQRLVDWSCRFDVVLIQKSETGHRIEVIQNAFEVSCELGA